MTKSNLIAIGAKPMKVRLWFSAVMVVGAILLSITGGQLGDVKAQRSWIYVAIGIPLCLAIEVLIRGIYMTRIAKT